MNKQLFPHSAIMPNHISNDLGDMTPKVKYKTDFYFQDVPRSAHLADKTYPSNSSVRCYCIAKYHLVNTQN